MNRDHDLPAEYLTIDQFRARWGVSRSTVYRWIGRGLVRTIPIGERGLRIPREEVDKLAERLDVSRK